LFGIGVFAWGIGLLFQFVGEVNQVTFQFQLKAGDSYPIPLAFTGSTICPVKVGKVIDFGIEVFVRFHISKR